ncbi:MAG TPA: hypothetical protein VFC51_09955 [Chloroflexota bacterium]|nr:hypothetical protein [Chloroflexota bacterium]
MTNGRAYDQLLNQTTRANPDNLALQPMQVTLSRSDLVTFA